jgi:hypothetical protein
MNLLQFVVSKRVSFQSILSLPFCFLEQNIFSSSLLFSFTVSYSILLGEEVAVVESEEGAGVGGKRWVRRGEAGVGGCESESQTVFLIFVGAILVQNSCRMGTLGRSSGSA